MTKPNRSLSIHFDLSFSDTLTCVAFVSNEIWALVLRKTHVAAQTVDGAVRLIRPFLFPAISQADMAH